MIEINKVYNEDCLDVMKRMDSCSVDMILQDPPYNTTACKWEWDIMEKIDEFWAEWKRIIKPNGAIVMTASQPFTSKLVMSNLEWFKYEWIWSKGRGTGFQIIRYKPLVSHENILIFGLGRTIYNPQMRERERPRVSKNKGTTRQMLVSNGNEYQAENALTQRYPITELLFPNNNQGDKLHPTQKPTSLFEYLILTYTNLGALVFDGFGGSGTTAIAAINTGRNYIVCETDKKYYNIASDRISNHVRQLVLD